MAKRWTIEPRFPDTKDLRFGMGLDEPIKRKTYNTAKHRTHSLFRRGCTLYELIPNVPAPRPRPLVALFHEYLDLHEAFNQTFAIVQKIRGWLSVVAIRRAQSLMRLVQRKFDRFVA